jgi:colanic acid/amylovoran biosynthesis glycosyltransferase
LFAKWPRKYLALLGIAFRTQTLVDFLIGFDFAWAMKSFGVTSIHCNEGLHSLNIGFYCNQILGLPLTVTIYADGLYAPPSPAMFRMALGTCAAVITVCDFNRDLLIKDFGIPADKVRVVRLHVDTNRFRPRQQVSVLIVGQFAERKGHEILLRALHALDRDDIVVWVVGGRLSGGGDDYVDVAGLASQLGVAGRVVFFGNVSEEVLIAVYQACDIFCLPSRFRFVREGTPVSLMEAMASGLPVISTRHAGIPEYVEQVLVEEDDVEGLARAIAFLADHPEIREAQGKRNREIVKARFSTRNIDDLIAVFQEVESGVPGERV